MNDFQRRYLDILQSTDYISSVARPGRKIVNIDYFAYNNRIGTDTVPIANGAIGQGQIDFQADSDFVLTYMSAAVQNAAGGALIFNPNCTVQLTDQGSGKTFFNTPTLMALAFGGGGFPFLLPSPRVMNPNTSMLIQVLNSTGGNLFGIYTVFHGARIFYAD
jgi:hypothetical protein